jgi:hypothetical protein
LRDQQIWTVNNNSSTDIFIEFKHEYDDNIRFDTISVGEENMIYYMEGLGGGQTPEDPTLSTHIFISNDTDTLTKDENLNGNWDVSIEKIKKNNDALRYDFNFTVSNSDF